MKSHLIHKAQYCNVTSISHVCGFLFLLHTDPDALQASRTSQQVQRGHAGHLASSLYILLVQKKMQNVAVDTAGVRHDNIASQYYYYYYLMLR